MTLLTTTIPCPLGNLRAFASPAGLRALLWPEIDPARNGIMEPLHEEPRSPVFVELRRQLDEYFDGARQRFELPLDPVGTEFQHLAWRALQTIPFGTTRSYGTQAASIGRPKAARAIGAANARNPLSIIVPCHRVVGADGSLTGFAGGVDRKRSLIERESLSLALP